MAQSHLHKVPDVYEKSQSVQAEKTFRFKSAEIHIMVVLHLQPTVYLLPCFLPSSTAKAQTVLVSQSLYYSGSFSLPGTTPSIVVLLHRADAFSA